MISPLSLLLAVILLITCSGCFWERGRGGSVEHDRGGYEDRDRGGYGGGAIHDDRRDLENEHR